jgi:hypothetical protein
MISDLTERIQQLEPRILQDFALHLIIFLYSSGCRELWAPYDPVNGSIETTADFAPGSDVCDTLSQAFDELGLLEPSKVPTRLYQVVAIYADNNQRYWDEFWAASPQAAEAAAKAKAAEDGNELIVAAVLLNGEVVS